MAADCLAAIALVVEAVGMTGTERDVAVSSPAELPRVSTVWGAVLVACGTHGSAAFPSIETLA